MKTLLIAFMLFSYSAHAQQIFYSIEAGKTANVAYKTPFGGLSAGVTLKDFYTVEAGFKTNGQEYYTLLYAAAGVQTKGKLLLAANIGAGWTFNIPQLDRRFDPVTGETKIISEGYDSKSIFALNASVKAGYQVLPNIKIYSAYTLSFKNWVSGGIILFF